MYIGPESWKGVSPGLAKTSSRFRPTCQGTKVTSIANKSLARFSIKEPNDIGPVAVNSSPDRTEDP